MPLKRTPMQTDMTIRTDKMLGLPAGALSALTDTFGENILAQEETRGMMTLYVAPGALLDVLEFCKTDERLKCEQLTDITAVDWPEREKRFDVVYHLLSYANKIRLRLKIQVAENESVPTAVRIYPGADWPEREVYDMFGIPFENHPDLRRILMWDGFDGWPLRKDFPLIGKDRHPPAPHDYASQVMPPKGDR